MNFLNYFFRFVLMDFIVVITFDEPSKAKVAFMYNRCKQKLKKKTLQIESKKFMIFSPIFIRKTIFHFFYTPKVKMKSLKKRLEKILLLGRVHLQLNRSQCEKNQKFTLTLKIFREINLHLKLIEKKLISRNFRETILRVKFNIFHIV